VRRFSRRSAKSLLLRAVYWTAMLASGLMFAGTRWILVEGIGGYWLSLCVSVLFGIGVTAAAIVLFKWLLERIAR
jgi:hypothetical protein